MHLVNILKNFKIFNGNYEVFSPAQSKEQ